MAPSPAKKTRADIAAIKKYAIAHGVERGGSSAKRDALPTGDQPPLNPDSSDENLLVFVQSVLCRRRVWAEIFENSLNSIGEYIREHILIPISLTS